MNSLEAHLASNQAGSKPSAVQLRDREGLAQLVAGIAVHRDKLIIRFKSGHTDEAPAPADDPSLTIAWHKPPSRRARRIMLPHNASRREIRPEQFERRARLVSAIAKGRRWLDDVVSGRVTSIIELCTPEKCSVRQVNMKISLAFLAPTLSKRPWKVACPAASASSGSAIRRLNGAGSSRPWASIRNNPTRP